MRSAALRFLSIAVALCAPALAGALELRAPATALSPTLDVSAQTERGLRLSLTLPTLAVEEFTIEGERYQALTLPGGALAGADGEAGLPTITRFVALPAGMQARVAAVRPSEQRFAGYRVLPVQPDAADRFVIDREWYARAAASTPSAALGAPAQMNALRVVPITFSPVGYDPATGELRVAERLEVELEFAPDPAAPALRRPALIPESFDRLYRDLVVNLEQSELYRDGDAVVGPGTYLLIYPDITGVLTRLQPLIDLRKRQGYNVIAVSNTTTGSTNTAIKTYIQNTYNTVNPPLEFVTLAGDASGTYTINCWNETLSGYSGEGDHYYTTLAGGDILADVHIGRLTYRSTAELDIIVNKILTYETNPPLTDSGWFTRAGLCGDPSQSGIGVVYVNQWVKTQLLRQGYTQVDTIFGGNYPTLMMQSINQGLSAFGYRGWWGMSGMTSNSILSLTNGNELPFALVVTCGTGSFKSDNTAISEAWTKAANGGGIGAVGTATLGTHTRYNNTYYKGCWDGALNGSDHRLGVAHTRGKYELYSAYQIAEPTRVEIWSMWNNLMGDPATDMYTGHPAALSVSYPTGLPVGASAVPVTVTSGGQPVVGARIALTKSGEVRTTAYTDAGGNAVLPLTANVTTGTLLVTVTGHNLIAHLGSLTIGAQSVFPALADHALDDDAAGASLGNNDGRLSPGERLELALALQNLGANLATDVTATLSGKDPYVELLSASQSFGDIAAGATAWGAAPFVFALAADAPAGHVVDLVVTAHSGLASWVSLLQLTVSSADLQYQNFTWSGGGGSLDPGESGTLNLTLQNAGDAAASGVTATLVSHSPWVTVTDGVGSFPDFALGASGNNLGDPFGLSVAANTFPGHLASFSLLLSYNDRAVEEVEFQLTVGTAALGSPTGPSAYGYYAFESTDTGHPQAPVYNWVEIAPNFGGTGTSVGLNDFGSSDDTNVLDLPFNFRYFGQDFDQLSVCSNGWVAMGTTYLVAFRNYNIPCSGAPPYLIAPFWDNLYQSGQNLVYYKYDSAGHRFIVQWSRLLNDWNSSTENFELILLDPIYHPTVTGDGEIIFQYHTVNNVDSENGYATVGIMNGDRTDGLLISYWNQHPTSASNPAANRAIRFLPLSDALIPGASVTPSSMETVLFQGLSVDRVLQVGNTGEQGSLLYYALDTAALPSWLTASSGATGTVQAGRTEPIGLHFDSAGLAAGSYETTLAINTSGGHLVVPVTLTVSDDATASDAAPAVLTLGQNHPNPFNPSTQIDFGLPAASSVRLTVFDVSGRAVATLIDGTLPAGWQRVNWDGRDAQGAAVAAGVYLYRLDVGAERIQRKMLLVK